MKLNPDTKLLGFIALIAMAGIVITAHFLLPQTTQNNAYPLPGSTNGNQGVQQTSPLAR